MALVSLLLPRAGEGWDEGLLLVIDSGMGTVRRTISPYAAQLRRHSTDAEQVMWAELRGRRLAGHKFKRQWTIGPYIVDFCCIEAQLVVELDGSQHTPEADAARTRFLEQRRFRVLRFWNNDVLQSKEGVLIAILEALGGTRKKEDPHPDPLPRAGEGV